MRRKKGLESIKRETNKIACCFQAGEPPYRHCLPLFWQMCEKRQDRQDYSHIPPPQAGKTARGM